MAIIDGEDLSLSWDCSGHCRAARETAIEFSIDADTNIPFENLNCFAFDLQHDPHQRHRIRPFLVGPDGVSRKIVVPFLAPLVSLQPFHVALTCDLPHCIKGAVDCYTATLSFEQESIPEYSATLKFKRDFQKWVRVYECLPDGTVTLLRDLPPRKATAEEQEYVDIDYDVPGKAIRAYSFFRSTVTHAVKREKDRAGHAKR